jgi:nicotinate-nucleotide pyrophosphorylase (carboxylating)
MHNRRGRQPIEIEVRSLEELQQALEHGAEAILLDHVSVEHVRKAVEICSRQPRRIPLECAGGINLENVRSYAETGVDFISVGALTHSSTAVDMSLRVTPA